MRVRYLVMLRNGTACKNKLHKAIDGAICEYDRRVVDIDKVDDFTRGLMELTSKATIEHPRCSPVEMLKNEFDGDLYYSFGEGIDSLFLVRFEDL